MSHELRKAMLTALSLVAMGSFYNLFGDDQQHRISVPLFTNHGQVYHLPVISQLEPFTVNQGIVSRTLPLRAAVILVEFSDQKITMTPEQWRRLVFSVDKPSVNQFFTDSSQGKISIMPILEHSGLANDGMIQVALEMKHPNNGGVLTSETYEGVFNAIKAAAEELSLEDLDTNRDQILQSDEIIWIVVFAGYEDLYKKVGEKSSSGFSHELRKYGPIKGYGVTDFVQVGELYCEDLWTGQSSISTHGILTHEVGHILGLPDLYDTDYSSQGVGLFSLMGNGDKLFYQYGKMGEAPSDLDPWSKIYLGFVKPQVIRESGEYLLSANSWGGSEILLIPTEVAGEYFLIENRQLKNQDEGLSLFADDGGVLIWHVDESRLFRRLDENKVNEDESQRGVDLEESSEAQLGYEALNRQPNENMMNFFYGEGRANLFNDETHPSSKLNNGNTSGIAIEVLGSGENIKIIILFKK